VVEDDDAMRDSMIAVLSSAGYQVRAYWHVEEFLANRPEQETGCVLSDVQMPGLDGLALLRMMRAEGSTLPVVLITAHGGVPMAVEAMKAGAVDFLEKPYSVDTLLAAVESALQARARDTNSQEESRTARRKLESLTPRERDVLERLINGNSNKAVAAQLGLSPRTVEFHRAHIMSKTDAKSLPDLVRLWMAATAEGPIQSS
jgi:two-component system response regulator FixJ